VTVPNFEQIELSPNSSLAAGDPKYRGSVQNTTTDWQQGLRIIKKHWPLSALFAAAMFSAIAIVTYSITPSYESTARLEIDPPGSEAFSLATNGPSANKQRELSEARTIYGEKARTFRNWNTVSTNYRIKFWQSRGKLLGDIQTNYEAARARERV
jgi:hypothetical protein